MHLTNRCLWIELHFRKHLAYGFDWAHIDQICEQLYMDDLKSGINSEFKSKRVRRKK